MLDTNTVSYALKNCESVLRNLTTTVMIPCISAITEGEILYGLAKRPQSARLRNIVRELVLRVEVLPWTTHAARHYGPLRADLERGGKTLSHLDLLIAAHAIEAEAVLATSDQAFANIKGLRLVNWNV